jgi:hypothetical protein
MVRNNEDVGMLTDDERLREVARILAAGVFRLRNRAALPPATTRLADTQILLESSPNCLEVPSETRLSVHTG